MTRISTLCVAGSTLAVLASFANGAGAVHPASPHFGADAKGDC